MSETLTSRHKNELDMKKKHFQKIIIIYDNLCAKLNGVTGQNLG